MIFATLLVPRLAWPVQDTTWILPFGWKIERSSASIETGSALVGPDGLQIAFTMGSDANAANALRREQPKSLSVTIIDMAQPIEFVLAPDGRLALSSHRVASGIPSAFDFMTRVNSGRETAVALLAGLTHVDTWLGRPYGYMEGERRIAEPVSHRNPGDPFVGTVQLPQGYSFRRLSGSEDGPEGGQFECFDAPTVQVTHGFFYDDDPDSRDDRWKEVGRTADFGELVVEGRGGGSLLVKKKTISRYADKSPLFTTADDTPKAVFVAVLARLSYRRTPPPVVMPG